MAASTGHLGPTIFRSTDLGKTWKETNTPPAFPKVPEGQKGRVVDHVLLAHWPSGTFGKAGGVFVSFQVLPRSVERKDRRSQVAGAGRHEHRPAISRIQHQMMHDVTEEHWGSQLPSPVRSVAAQDERTLACADQQRHRAVQIAVKSPSSKSASVLSFVRGYLIVCNVSRNSFNSTLKRSRCRSRCGWSPLNSRAA